MDDVARHVRDHCPGVARHSGKDLQVILLNDEHPKKHDVKVQRMKRYLEEAPLPGDYEEYGLNDDTTPIKPRPPARVFSQSAKNVGSARVTRESKKAIVVPALGMKKQEEVSDHES